jgi:hypothetical protein
MAHKSSELRGTFAESRIAERGFDHPGSIIQPDSSWMNFAGRWVYFSSLSKDCA